MFAGGIARLALTVLLILLLGFSAMSRSAGDDYGQTIVSHGRISEASIVAEADEGNDDDAIPISWATKSCPPSVACSFILPFTSARHIPTIRPPSEDGQKIYKLHLAILI